MRSWKLSMKGCHLAEEGREGRADRFGESQLPVCSIRLNTVLRIQPHMPKKMNWEKTMPIISLSMERAGNYPYLFILIPQIRGNIWTILRTTRKTEASHPIYKSDHRIVQNRRNASPSSHNWILLGRSLF